MDILFIFISGQWYSRKMCIQLIGSWFDIIMGFAPDYMHCVFQGISKTLLRLWFSPVYKEYDFFIGDKVS